MSQIASPHNPRLKAVRRLHSKRERARSGSVPGRGRGPDRGGRARRAPGRWRATALAGSGLGNDDFHDVERSALAAVSTLGSGTRVIGRLRAALGRAARAAVRLPAPRRRSRQRRHGAALRRRRSAPRCVALGPGCADPHGPKAVRASMGAIFTVALARVRDVAELPGERIALVADASEPLRGRARTAPGPARARDHAAGRRRARGAARGGGGRVRAGRAHPDRVGLAQRRDGRDRGAVRDDPPMAGHR